MIKGFEAHEAITAVINWSSSEGNEWFDASFVTSLSEKLEEYGELTDSQEVALENIINKCKIDIPEYV